MIWGLIKQAVKPIAFSNMHRYGLELTRTMSLASFLSFNRVDLVVDVGANEGQFARKLRWQGYDGPILSFEPISSVFETLSGHVAKDRLWDARRLAIGAEQGEAEINVALASDLSSMKPVSQFGLGWDARVETVKVEKVKVARLDDELRGVPGRRLFLKIDTQGFEREVMQGAPETLERCVGLMLELPVEHIYDDMWSFGQALNHLDALGFVPAQIRHVASIGHDPTSYVEFDCVFRRKRDWVAGKDVEPVLVAMT